MVQREDASRRVAQPQPKLSVENRAKKNTMSMNDARTPPTPKKNSTMKKKMMLTLLERARSKHIARPSWSADWPYAAARHRSA